MKATPSFIGAYQEAQQFISVGHVQGLADLLKQSRKIRAERAAQAIRNLR